MHARDGNHGLVLGTAGKPLPYQLSLRFVGNVIYLYLNVGDSIKDLLTHNCDLSIGTSVERIIF